MGLISWIKDKYYDSQLNKADKLVLENDLNRAEEIYRSLLGKQDQAVVNLANMFATHANNVEERLKALKNILDLRENTNEVNQTDYEKELFSHVNNLEKFAVAQFNSEHYHEAVLIADAIKHFKASDDNFGRTCHQYHAYLAFQTSQQRTSYDTSLSEAIQELKAYVGTAKNNNVNTLLCGHINHFISVLSKGQRYTRCIKLLLPFLEKSADFKGKVVSSIVNVVKGEDAEVKKIKSLSDVCTDTELCIEAANILAKMSSEAAKAKDYVQAVRLDTFAAEFLSKNNDFNNNRCSHILEEQSTRANAKEIANLLKLAKDLSLTDEQVATLKKRISQIASSAEPEKAIDICRLYIPDSTFGPIYIKQAEKLIESQKTKAINTKELLDVITQNTDKDSFPDVLIPFVNSISEYEIVFFNSTVDKILRIKSMSLLEKYWKVNENSAYFFSLISDKSDLSKETVSFVVDNHKLFLHTKALKSDFIKALESLKDDVYAQNIAENLIKNKCNVNEHFVEITLRRANHKEIKEALQIINYGLNLVSDQLLINRKKELIRQLISVNDFTIAETETKSLQGLDKESDTLLAELYYSRGNAATEFSQKKESFFLVLDVCEKGKVLSSFDNLKKDVLKEICSLSQLAYNEGRESDAYLILDRIASYQTYWLPLYIELRNKDLSKVDSLGQKVKFLEETISQLVLHVGNLKEIGDPSYTALWENYINLLYQKTKSQPKDKAIESLSKARKLIQDYCSDEIRSGKTENLTKEIVKLEWSYATELESDLEFEKATKYYEAVKNDDVPSYKGRAELRALICSVKAGKIDSSVERRISAALCLKSHESLKDDLAYRYACYLLKSTRPGEAEKLLKQYLPNESDLLSLCDNIYIKESEKHLFEFNKKIKAVIEGTMTVSEATAFLKEIDTYKASISSRLTDTTSKFDSYKSKLESYILREMFNEEQYEAVFDKLLSMYPNYIQDDSQFRNVAIAALGLVESGKAKEKGLKYAISIWLSAVYTDRLFVKSLDYTSWDDEYTFTLLESLGQTNDYDYEELPENINFDNPVDNHNVAIKDVQEALVSRMETFIRDNYPKYEEFYNKEKESLDGLIGLNLDQDYIIASPYLASQLPKVKKNIKASLDYDVEKAYDNKEDALDLGVRYGFTDNEYSSYYDAQQKVEKCKSSITGSLQTIRSAFQSIPQIRNYSKLYASIKSFVSSRMNEDIKSKLDYKKFIDVYEIICKAVNDAPMSLAFSNYCNGEIVKRLNDDTMQLRDGVGLMVRVYNIAPSSIQVKQNLEGMLSALAVEAEQNNNSSDRAIVDNAVRNTGNAFKAKVDDARIQAALSVIVDKVNGGSMSKDKALKEVYELYKKNSNNDRICENLVTLCDMCIMEYIIADKWGASSVKTTLDALNNNKSAAFNRHKGKLAQSYANIWNQLSPDNRMLLMGISVPGTSLNDKGLALKAGLNYYKKLGDVRSSSKPGSLGALFGDYPF